MVMIDNRLGNETWLLASNKTGFLCSRKFKASSVMRSYDWAIEQRNSGTCVIGGFHSKLEKDVLHFLLQGSQPLVIVLARGMYRRWGKRWDPLIKNRLAAGNLLIISPFEDSVTKVTPQTCKIRNQLIIELADKLVIGYCDPIGKLAKLLKDVDKPIEYLA
jgi:hypothetical protein